MKEPGIVLKKGKERSLERFHPWIFSGAIGQILGNPAEGDVLEVYNQSGDCLGTGFYGTGSIAVRLIGFESIEVDSAFWEKKIAKARALRQSVGLVNNPHTNIYRLIHAEGDELPGLIVDVYGSTAVFQAHHAGIHNNRNEIAKAIRKVLGDEIRAVYDKSSHTLPRNSSAEDGWLAGTPDEITTAQENGHSFEVDVEHGQKTGFFIDQRENRKLLGSMSLGKKVLNTFCYTGGFSVYALAGGASLVHSVDSSQQALDGCNRNVELLGGAANLHESFKADAVQFVKELPQDYDIIVLDPPAFAKHQKARHQAVQAYKRLNAHAIRQIKPGGIIFTFSCSQVVDTTLFNRTVSAAAISCGRSVRILHQLHQPADHPVNIFHPESEYLKGLVIQVD
jgi:23S rRNA (cytosine1962-C5)-methyltransferase